MIDSEAEFYHSDKRVQSFSDDDIDGARSSNGSPRESWILPERENKNSRFRRQLRYFIIWQNIYYIPSIIKICIINSIRITAVDSNTVLPSLQRNEPRIPSAKS